MFFRLKCLAAAAILLPQIVLADGPDQQTPEEIAAAKKAIERDFQNMVLPHTLSFEAQKSILDQYDHLDPKREVPTALLKKTVLFFHANKSSFPNQSHISVLDFGRRSNQQRFWVIDMRTGQVQKYWTTHGWASDKNNDGYAEQFGNVVNSGMSSLGFIRTAEIYWGKFKRSVRLDGLESTNSKIRERAIVLHGWDNAFDKPVIQGLSWGCPALDWSVKDSVIDKVAEGSLMLIGVAK